MRYCAYSTFIRLISGETTSTVILTSRIHTRIHNGQGLKYNRLSYSSWRFTKTSLFDSKTNRRLPLDAYWGYQTRKLNSPIFFNTRLRELHALSLCATSSDMQGEMWLAFKRWRHGNRSRGSSSQTLFSVEISDSRKYVCVRRLYNFRLGDKYKLCYLPAGRSV